MDPAADDGPLLELALAVTDGRSFDLSARARELDATQLAVIKRLQQIEAVAGVHSAAGDGPPEMFDSIRASHDTGMDVPIRWGPFDIREKIGRGSYGDVYRAWDPRLGREVALKLLRYRESKSAEGSAPVHEGYLLAQVRHPNVVTVYGAERIDGRTGLWMEFVQGETLAGELRRRGPLPPDEVAEIGIQLCDALQAVHAAGLLHRDIKAQNVVRQPSGRVVLMDFGTGNQGTDASDRVGLAGTPAYLAPEVLAGGTATVKSDVYSLGVLLAYLATAKFPVRGSSITEIREAHRSFARIRLRTVRPELSPALAAVIERAHDPDPARRPETAAELRTALAEVRTPVRRWRAVTFVIAASLVAACSIGLAVAWQARAPSTARVQPAFGPHDVVVMVPFENRTRDVSLTGLADAMLERELWQSRSVSLASRERIADTLALMGRPPGTSLDVPTAVEVCRRDPGARAILTGRVETVERRLILAASFLNPTTGQVVAQATDSAADANGLPGAVRRISNRLRIALGETRSAVASTAEQLERVTTPSLAALRAYSESYRLGTDPPPRNWLAARALVDQALALDPEFPSARIWRAWILVRQRDPEFRAAAAAALAVADRATPWEQHWIRGSYYYLRSEHAKAVESYEALLKLRPDHEQAIRNLSFSYGELRRLHDVARMAVRRAHLRPNEIEANVSAAVALGNVGDFSQASTFTDRIPWLLRGRESEDPGNVAFALSVPVYEAMRARDAEAALRLLDALKPRLEQSTGELRRFLAWQLSHGYLSLGRVRDARAAAKEIPSPNERHIFLARIAFFAQDLPVVRDEIRGVSLRALQPNAAGHATAAISLMIAGRLFQKAEAEITILRELMPARANDGEISLRGQLALAKGDLSLALTHLESAWAVSPAQPSPSGVRVAASLAVALVRAGNAQRAKTILTTALENRERASLQPSYWSFIPALAQLAQIHRGLGEGESARVIETDLQRLLLHADPELPLLSDLRKTAK